MKKVFLLCFSLFFITFYGYTQDKEYVAPHDPLVRQKLKQWQDKKFGLMMHWGAYSQWGVVESWSICPEDEGWTQRHGHGSDHYFMYLKNYENLLTTFNPTNFDPDKWARSAQYAGMKYVVFTTKHHDGFCMFDTHQTDYKITSKRDPFHTNPKANITREVFKAFRKDNFEIGAYFSKPDWHSPYFWWPYFPPLDRFPNYDEAKYPDRWQKFKDFTFNQIKELLNGDYGGVDILWLDGGWVRPHSDSAVQRHPRRQDDVDMAHIAQMARKEQPGLIMVDRAVGGLYENYRTPEQQVPDHVLSYPWETCMTMGTSWSYKPNDTYKSSSKLIHLLVKIVAYGGNFLLNIGPSGKGDWDPTAYERLKDIGDWMKINSTGIYATRPMSPYHEKNIYFTQKKDHSASFAFYIAKKGNQNMPQKVHLSHVSVDQGSKVHLLGYPNALQWKEEKQGIVISIPSKLQNNPPCQYAWTFKWSSTP